MDNTYTPLVTDEHIERASGDPIAAQAVSAYEFGKCIGMARGMASARSTYEADRVQTHAELAELRAENERYKRNEQSVSDALATGYDSFKHLIPQPGDVFSVVTGWRNCRMMIYHHEASLIGGIAQQDVVGIRIMNEDPAHEAGDLMYVPTVFFHAYFILAQLAESITKDTE